MGTTSGAVLFLAIGDEQRLGLPVDLKRGVGHTARVEQILPLELLLDRKTQEIVAHVRFKKEARVFGQRDGGFLLHVQMPGELPLDPVLLGVLTPKGKAFDGIVHMVGNEPEAFAHAAFYASRIAWEARRGDAADAGHVRQVHGTSYKWKGFFLRIHAACIP